MTVRVIGILPPCQESADFIYLVKHSGSWEWWQKPVVPILGRLSKQNPPMIMMDGDDDNITAW